MNEKKGNILVYSQQKPAYRLKKQCPRHLHMFLSLPQFSWLALLCPPRTMVAYGRDNLYTHMVHPPFTSIFPFCHHWPIDACWKSDCASRGGFSPPASSKQQVDGPQTPSIVMCERTLSFSRHCSLATCCCNHPLAINFFQILFSPSRSFLQSSSELNHALAIRPFCSFSPLLSVYSYPWTFHLFQYNLHQTLLPSTHSNPSLTSLLPIWLFGHTCILKYIFS